MARDEAPGPPPAGLACALDTRSGIATTAAIRLEPRTLAPLLTRTWNDLPDATAPVRPVCRIRPVLPVADGLCAPTARRSVPVGSGNCGPVRSDRNGPCGVLMPAPSKAGKPRTRKTSDGCPVGVARFPVTGRVRKPLPEWCETHSRTRSRLLTCTCFPSVLVAGCARCGSTDQDGAGTVPPGIRCHFSPRPRLRLQHAPGGERTRERDHVVRRTRCPRSAGPALERCPRTRGFRWCLDARTAGPSSRGPAKRRPVGQPASVWPAPPGTKQTSSPSRASRP